MSEAVPAWQDANNELEMLKDRCEEQWLRVEDREITKTEFRQNLIDEFATIMGMDDSVLAAFDHPSAQRSSEAILLTLSKYPGAREPIRAFKRSISAATRRERSQTSQTGGGGEAMLVGEGEIAGFEAPEGFSYDGSGIYFHKSTADGMRLVRVSHSPDRKSVV